MDSKGLRKVHAGPRLSGELDPLLCACALSKVHADAGIHRAPRRVRSTAQPQPQPDAQGAARQLQRPAQLERRTVQGCNLPALPSAGV